MDDIGKLQHLLSHWVEHNQEHVKNYLLWAERAESWGNQELAGILREIAGENDKLNELFSKARQAAQGS